LQQNEYYGINTYPPGKTVVGKRKAYKEPPGYKSYPAHHYCQHITNVPGSVVEAYFYFGGLSANKTFFMHVIILPDVGTYRIFKQLAFPAAWTSAAKYGGKVSPAGLGCAHMVILQVIQYFFHAGTSGALYQ
jgi:hypothetical protein